MSTTRGNGLLTRKYQLNGFNKLSGLGRKEERNAGEASIQYKHTYFVTAVPTVFDNMFGSTEIFQYTTSEYSKPGRESGVVFL